MDPDRYLIVLPTYDERENLPRMVEALEAVRARMPFAGEVLVVDDNSPDGTGRLADDLAGRHDWLSVLHRPGKQGLGRAYLAGFDWALQRPYSHIVEMDSDLSHPVTALPAMLTAAEHADLVLGSRYTPGGGVDGWPLSRRLISQGGCGYARRILGVDVRDLTGGFKCFRRWVLESLDLSDVRAGGYAFQIELTYRTLRMGGRVVELPITFVDRAYGESKMSRAIVLEAVRQVPALRLRALRGRLVEGANGEPRISLIP
ncbi:MAG: dolichol-phosphate mannosyltransferase [Gaiellales bacterium]|jgi:dolichol-phosphate mannosyltransferase|nr:dolichol-phosphate mannosyltransferase [Gaiellales bacterium]